MWLGKENKLLGQWLPLSSFLPYQCGQKPHNRTQMATSIFLFLQLINIVAHAPPILRPRLIVRFIPLPRLPTHPTRRVVIKRNRPPRNAFRRGQRLRMPMVAVLVRIKNHTPVINRQHLLQAFLHPDIPKLQVAAVRLLPVLGQVNNQVQPALNVELFVQAEIRVHAQEAAGFGFV